MNIPDSISSQVPAQNTCIIHADWGVLRVQCLDAAAFLHGQLSQDILQLPLGHSRLAAYCAANGRMLASLYVYRLGEAHFLLLCAADSVAYLLARLKMFVLRSKVTLEDASTAYRIVGYWGSEAAALLSTDTTRPTLPLPSSLGQARAIVLQELGAEQDSSTKAGAANEALADSDALAYSYWHWLEVHSVLAHIGSQNRDRFVPQMLNYESLGAINFQKGCYPGQEVVARSQYRGQIKRRAYLVLASHALPVGADVVASKENEEDSSDCGTVVQSASYQGQHAAIVCLQTTAFEAAKNGSEALYVRLAAEAQPPEQAQCIPLQVQDLPYPLLQI